MNDRRVKRFVAKIMRRVILLVALLIIVLAMIESPIITNEIALGQMQNSSGAFMLMGVYSPLRKLIKAVLWLLVAMQAITIGRDIYDFIKSINKEKN